MPTYSSERFYHDWRFDIEKDFIDAEGNPFKYAENGKQSWGDELHKLEFDSTPAKATVSYDGKRLAVAAGHEVHIVEIDDFERQTRQILKVHTSNVDVVAFQPGNSDLLVSLQSYPELSPGDTQAVCHYAADQIVAKLTEINQAYSLNDEERQFLSKTIGPNLDLSIARHLVADNFQLSGRLTGSFQSEIFNCSGNKLIYLPGKRPRSNDVDTWDINAFSTEKKKDVFTLSGHTDAVMWVGFSSDDKLIGTVAWDRTMRTWDATNGNCKFTFETTGTTGNGSLHVYLLDDGTEVLCQTFGNDWSRAISWSPAASQNLLAVGGRGCGIISLLDIDEKRVLQQRVLSTAKSVGDPTQRFLARYVAVQTLKFVDQGRKLAFFTTGDGSAEVYDLEHEQKWRFAREGTDPDSASETTSKGGSGVVIWEDRNKGRLMLGSVDFDALRIWSVPLDKRVKDEGEWEVV
ncbi:putative f-box and wd40 domain protein [Phaeomoniella chlamydospora]|uniref:Mitochondrial division protein 1 n=1 Tax=Phaeomoniella chlamydospora TaxID=158046 RepID=A0A0G2E8V7_PHACM|nr:putative f-box and wd40 domain protein [Phaeomoniella chlamydospora]